MGVPGFYSWIMRKYGHIKHKISPKYIGKMHDLYIDLNCLLHPSCQKALIEANGNAELIDDRLIKQCINDLNKVIMQFKPSRLLYVAVDGVAPMAKIAQQRKRRYRKSKESTNEIWTNLSITPGTEFMAKLDTKLRAFFRFLNISCEVIYSSHDEHGEGEHKIFDKIRGEQATGNIGIYGMDADLIFLSMANCNTADVTLIRDMDNTGNYTYVQISELRNVFNEHVSQCAQIRKMDRIKDIIFICSLLGNDFIPNIPNINISNGGMDLIMDGYIALCRAYANETIINVIDGNIKIDMPMFDVLINMLSNDEHRYFKNNDEFKKYFNIRAGAMDDMKFSYYEKNCGCIDNQEGIINKMCENYLEGITWIIKYYLYGCAAHPSWTWKYNYTCGPFMTDICKYIKNSHHNVNAITFDVSKPLDQIVQLICVIPPSYNRLIPERYRELYNYEKSDIAYMFPMEFNEYTYDKKNDWQFEPILPQIDLMKIINALQSMK